MNSSQSDFFGELENQVVMVDDEYSVNLQLFHYKSCTNESNPLVKKIRGVVRSGSQLISSSFGYIDELDVDKHESEILKRIHSFNQSKIYKMYEGTVVRMFYWKHRWFMSTHKKLNAFDSKWGKSGCKTFGEMFIDGLCNDKLDWKPQNPDIWDVYNNFCFSLNTEKTYVFLILHDNNTQMVCNNDETLLPIYHIGEFDNKTHLLVEGNTSGIPSLPQLSFNNPQEIIDYVRNMCPFKNQGIIVYFPNQTQLKIYNSNYKTIQDIRGNQPDIIFRYLEIRHNHEEYSKFFQVFGEKYSNEFSKVEKKIIDKSLSIFQSYMKRYIYKQFVFVPKVEFIVMELCHDWHLQNRDNNKIKAYVVYDFVNTLPTKLLYSLVKNTDEEIN
jgi:hypothetical protein